MSKEGLYFQALYDLGISINLLSIASFAFLATCIFMFIYIVKKRGY